MVLNWCFDAQCLIMVKSVDIIMGHDKRSKRQIEFCGRFDIPKVML